MALTSGSKLGPYEILAPLGAGGMGVVYKVYETTLDRHVALKVLPDEARYDQHLADERRVVADRHAPSCRLENRPQPP